MQICTALKTSESNEHRTHACPLTTASGVIVSELCTSGWEFTCDTSTSSSSLLNSLLWALMMASVFCCSHSSNCCFNKSISLQLWVISILVSSSTLLNILTISEVVVTMSPWIRTLNLADKASSTSIVGRWWWISYTERADLLPAAKAFFFWVKLKTNFRLPFKRGDILRCRS